MSNDPADAGERFEAMYNRTSRDILSYFARRVHSREDAADLLADVYLVAWRRWNDVPSPPEDRLWLFGVARRTLLAQRRADTRRHEAADALRDELRRRPIESPDTTVAPADQVIRVTEALKRLSAADRELVTLRLWDALTIAEVAKVVGVKEATVRVRLHRARRRLRTLLDVPDIHAARVQMPPPLPPGFEHPS